MKNTTQTLLLALLFASVLLASPTATYAHGEAGLVFTSTTTEGRIVDVDYREAYIEAGSFGRFDFNLFADDKRERVANFTDIWVRIVKKDGSRVGKTLYAGSVAKQEFGGNGFSFVFPEGGTYTLSVRYNDSDSDRFGETVGEAEFELDVLRSSDEDKFKFGMEFWVGLIGGLFVAVVGLLPILMRQKKE
jgi:hypothetical protein